MTPEQKQQMMEAVDRYFEEDPVFNPDISLFPRQHSHFEVMTIPEEDRQGKYQGQSQRVTLAKV